ncbi:PREDICTED: uncharacterized protein LOC18606211 [Theobroma cacao]|uniref:Uncharacterized protein LOC18606211 n=1 Tax=Theobroma cacao TaxID=3641 RepID=A0AB32VWS1_THECC|nr:PREDICTED: uncharacterized protein LOC18606211 [Theobroma cacao]XP_017972213.1 PREDICTED: uncharacterized protein LOC18606211 [Theobroma cacao]
MDFIKHFLHRHPLSFIDKGNEELCCSRCLKYLSGPTYGCSRCNFFIHDHCAELPPKIEHFLHPCPLVLKVLPLPLVYNCNLCIERGAGSSYRCEECNFDMHVECALKPTMKSEGEELIQHFTHWHPLQLVLEKKKEEDQVCCFICQKLCSGSATAYGCKQCEFFLHNSCMTSIPRKINHFFHPCPLILLTSPFIYTCGGCDERGSFLTFSCGRCCFQLDVKCALLPTVKSEDAKQIQHFSHQHPLALCESINGSEVRCRACEEICSGPTYTFGCSRCSFFFHRSCAVELPQQIHHPFHSKHPLTLSAFPLKNFQYYCAACGFDVRSLLAYRCDKCEFTLDKDCAKLTPSFKYGPHPHLLTLIDKTDRISCDICRKKANNFCLRCVACRFSIHLHCHLSVPKTINHKCHIHPLTLTDSPFEFELNSPQDAHNMDDEFYCDVCEEKRDKFNQVFYCVTCKFIAETRCVFSVLLSFLTNSDEQSRMSSRIISTDEENSEIDPVLAKLDEEIAKCREKAKPFELEIESLKRLIQKLQARLQELEAKLEPITWGLDKLEEDRFLYMYELKHKMKGKHSIEASP